MFKTVSIEEFKKEQKRREFKEKINRKIKDGYEWVCANKELVTVLTPIIASGTITVIKVVGKNINLRKAEQVKDLYCYDRSLGHYWKLRRELTNKEWLEIDRRRKNGERLADILSQMKVLK